MPKFGTYATFEKEESEVKKYTHSWYLQAISKELGHFGKRIDWLDYEKLARDILATSELSYESRVWLLRQALHAYTKRGLGGVKIVKGDWTTTNPKQAKARMKRDK